MWFVVPGMFALGEALLGSAPKQERQAALRREAVGLATSVVGFYVICTGVRKLVLAAAPKAAKSQAGLVMATFLGWTANVAAKKWLMTPGLALLKKRVPGLFKKGAATVSHNVHMPQTPFHLPTPPRFARPMPYRPTPRPAFNAVARI